MRGGNNFVDLSGQRFGKLSVRTRMPNIEGRVVYSCLCDCGAVKTISAGSLRAGKTKSCGCIRSEYMRKKATKHGFYGEPLRAVWSQMRQRCFNPNNFDYKYYGGRGIGITVDWCNYSVFREWSINAGYQVGLTIDRSDTNGDYCPENCRWITIQEQQRNRRPRKKD